MLTYEDLKEDLNIIATYELIDRVDLNPLSLHGIKHVTNVVNICEKVLNLLGKSEEIINLAKISAYLHDLGMKEGKKGHAKRSVKEAKEILKNKNLSKKQKAIIFNAIKNHSECGKQKDIVSATLIFADKLDADKTRLGSMGYNVSGLKQAQFIEKIEFDIENNTLNVFFTVTSSFDVKEFESYYHAEKIFNAVKEFASFNNLDYIIYLNKNIWVDKNGVKYH